VTSRPGSAAAAALGSRRGTRVSACGVQAATAAGDATAAYGGPLAAFGSTIGCTVAGNGNGIGSAVGANVVEGLGQLGRQGSAADNCSSRFSTWATSPAAATAASTNRSGYSAFESQCSIQVGSGAASPSCAGLESVGQACSASPGRRMAIAGPRTAGVNLLDPAGSNSSTAASAAGAGVGSAGSVRGGVAVPALQLSRLGSMHAPGAAAAAATGVTARPDSAGSSSRSRPNSAPSTSRLAVSARATGA
jgi:hypothetical protein